MNDTEPEMIMNHGIQGCHVSDTPKDEWMGSALSISQERTTVVLLFVARERDCQIPLGKDLKNILDF